MTIEATPDTLVIEDMNQFVQILVAWHSERVQALEHMLQVPDGTVMETNGIDATLTGDLLVGFKAGIELALMELGTLPFAYETDPPEAANDSAQPE